MNINKHFHFEELESTNKYAKELLVNTEAPFIVSADKQTAGRGRLGSKWASDSEAIYITYVIDISSYNFQIYHYPYLNALVIHRFLTQFTPNSEIKWPNDLLVSGKKISGILIEIENNHMIIGVGVNINQSKDYFDERGLNGTSLSIIKNDQYNLKEARFNLTSIFLQTYTYYSSNSDLIFDDWISNCVNIGQHIKCRVGDKIESGRCLGLGRYGELLLETNGGIQKIHAGEIIE